MFKTKPLIVPVVATRGEPTFEQRLLSAQLLSNDARQQFLDAALDLEVTGNELDVLAQETQREIDRLVGILDAARVDAEKARRVAKNLKDLVEAESDLTLF